jgi:hypothetical protein
MLLPPLGRTGGNLERRPRHCPFHISLSLPCIGSPYQRRRNGSVSEIRSTPRLSLPVHFFDSERAAVRNVWPVDVIFVKENIVELTLIDHFPASASVEVAFFGWLGSLRRQLHRRPPERESRGLITSTEPPFS